MIIKGFAKLTLLDYPGKVACTVFTGGCNFACPFCHNASLAVRAKQLPDIQESEVFDLLAKRKGVLDGVCITGGEPLLYGDDIVEFIEKVKDMGFLVKLDTNGTFPHKLKRLIDMKLIDKAAVDIKNSPEKYAMTVGLKKFDMAPLLETVDILKNSDIDYEFRTTVVKELHEKEDFHKIGEIIKGAKAYFLQAFVDSGDLIGTGLSAPSKASLEEFLEIAKLYVDNSSIRGA